MNAEALRGHALVLLATAAGILGMGLLFDAVMSAHPAEAVQGIPLLFLGLWWAGRDLGRSMIAARARKQQLSVQRSREPESHPDRSILRRTGEGS